MNNIITIFLFAVLLVEPSPSTATPAQTQATPTQLVELADQFYLQLSLNDQAKDHHDECPPSPTACAEAACSRVPSYHCDDRDEVLAITRACRGNFNDQCFNTVCDKLPSYSCDDTNEVIAVADACRGNYDGSCVKWVCSKLPGYSCNDLSELVDIAAACGGSTR